MLIVETRIRLRSIAMSTFSSAKYLNFLRAKARTRRKLSGKPAAVHYFHQVDDPYSHLVAQKLDQLSTAYSLPFIPHLVSKPATQFQGSSEHFDNWAWRDVVSIAADYGASLPCRSDPSQALEAAAVLAENDILAAHLDQSDFAAVAVQTGNALWAGGSLQHNGSQTNGAASVHAGDALRKKLGHYQGGMFYFDGEWFWGIDRIRLLEQRLFEEGFGDTGRLCVPEPTPADTSGLCASGAASQIVLEYFPSLRSPYTAVGHQRVLDLIARTGVTLKLRPVMPMLMRGIPAPFAKQQYIITDSGREARARGIPFGHIVDPFGDPVRRAFALFPAALSIGKGMQFVSAYLSAAWAQGIDITTDTGLQQVAANADIDWNHLKRAMQDTDWEAMLDDNVNDMLAVGLWGVPSFVVSGGNIETVFACWGQDRIWRVENEIARRA